jgi:hypothetical protein
MRRIPTLIAFVFIALTLSRVADYVAVNFHAGALSWGFSFGMALAIFVSSYYTRKTVKEEKTTNRNRRYAAWISLILFVFVDGFFNLAEVLRVAENASDWRAIGPWIYGLFPTGAAVLMGVLQGYLDREQNVKEWSFKKFILGLKDSKAGGSIAVQFLDAVMQASQGETIELTQVAPVRKKKEPIRKKTVTDDELLDVWQKEPTASDAQVADRVGVTRSAVQQRRNALQGRGVLMKTDKGIVIYSMPAEEEKNASIS